MKRYFLINQSDDHKRDRFSSSENIITPNWYAGKWNVKEVILLKVAILFFILMSVPTDYRFYVELFSVRINAAGFFKLVALTSYTPYWGLPHFWSWLFILIVSIVGGLLWSKIKFLPVEKDVDLYYWFRVLLRYRLAIGVIAFGLIKLFPLQIPFPSLSSLHTEYGQFLPWKIYYNTIGIIPWYESFLGAVEVFAGLLLLNRNTVGFGAGILVGFIGNVMAANFAYDLGNQVYSTFLFLISVVLLSNDVPRLYKLLIREHYTQAEKYSPVFKGIAFKARKLSKLLFISIITVFAVSSYANFRKSPFLIPNSVGLKNAYGFYNVKSFILNKDTLAYSRTNPNRWQDVVFEKWATLSIHSAAVKHIDETRNVGYASGDVDRIYESSGVGSRDYYSYVVDADLGVLRLYNKNPNNRSDSLTLHFKWLDENTLRLYGNNSKHDSINAVLERINKPYLFFVGRRFPVKM